MLNLQTRKVWISCDIYWTGKMYAHKAKKTLEIFYAEVEEGKEAAPTQTTTQEAPVTNNNDQDFNIHANNADEDNEQANQDKEVTQAPTKLPRAVAALQSYNNPGRKEANFCFHVHDTDPEDYITKEEPATFQLAWNHPDEAERQKWRNAI